MCIRDSLDDAVAPRLTLGPAPDQRVELGVGGRDLGPARRVVTARALERELVAIDRGPRVGRRGVARRDVLVLARDLGRQRRELLLARRQLGLGLRPLRRELVELALGRGDPAVELVGLAPLEPDLALAELDPVVEVVDDLL